MAVTVVIPVRNDAQRLDRCLTSLRCQGGTPMPVLVVDNGSTDDTVDVARRNGADVLVLPDIPVSAMRNRGAECVSDAEIVAFVDADHEVMPGWLQAGLDAIRRPGVVAAGALYEGQPVPTWVQRWYAVLRGRTEADGPVEWLAAGNMLVRRDAFAAAGGFDESLEACEDVDLCFRLRQAGGVIWGAPGMRSVHLGDPPTLGRLFRSELWRGRDNVRVTLRGPWSLRSLLSLGIPVAQVVSLPVAGVLSALGRPALGLVLVLAAWLPIALVRGLRMALSASATSLSSLPQAVAVAFVYDAGRAVALLWRASHHRTR